MVNINNYIQEKLYIGKNFKNFTPDANVVQEIINLTAILIMHKDLDKFIKDWVTDNYVNEVKYYVTKETYDILNNNYEIDEDKFLKHYIIDDEKVEYIKSRPLDEKHFNFGDNNVVDIEYCDEGMLYTGGYMNYRFTILVYKVK